jgi:opacity protein-like surface antigen
MKKVFVIGLLVLGFNLHSNAQAKLSLQGGLNQAREKYSGDGSSLTLGTRTSVNFGLNADFEGSDNFNLRSGLIYNGFGSKDKEDGEVLKLDYLTIPVLGRFKVAEGFYAFAGPQIGLLLSAKSKYKDETVDEKEFYKGTNISALIGAEYKFTDKLSLGASYNAGLTNIGKEDMDDGGKLTTTGFSVNFGFSF